MVNVFVHDFDFFVLVFGKSFLKVLNAKCTFILYFGKVVLKALGDELKDEVSVVLLYFGGKFFRHVTHGYNYIDNESGVSGVENGEHESEDVLELSFV